MDGFFEKYGRVIIIAVVICFVLLYLTPMRNVVGSSINGFAGNFANKVGESLGTVKMPDGSGGKITVPEGVKAGSILKIEGNEYIVLEQRTNNQVLVMAASSIGRKAFQSKLDYDTHLRLDGQYADTYEGSDIDDYLENEWYNGLSSTMKVAIQTTNIKQASYSSSSPDDKHETGYGGQVYNTLSRHVFLPSVEEIGKVVDLKNPDKVKMFLNVENINIWTRDSLNAEYIHCCAMCLSAEEAGLYANYTVSNTFDSCPAFVVDLTKVQSEIVGTTNYK